MTINLPDGSKVSEIVLPDGSTASEVIAPDGSVVFDAGGAIPDSAIHQWKYDEGSGTTPADSIGSNDGTISGATWTSVADLVGGYALSFDQTDDYVSYSTVSAVGQGEAFSFAATVNVDDQTNQVIWQHITSSSDRVSVNIENNNWLAGTWDGSSWTRREVSGGAETTRIRLCVVIDEPNGIVNIYVNATQADDQDGPGIAESSSVTGNYIGRETAGGAYLGGIVDNPVIYDTAISSSEVQQDYDAQPWT